MKIVFCIPGRNFSDKFLFSWTSTMAHCFTQKIEIHLANKYSSNVYYARNLCLGGNNLAGKNQKPWQGTIDYDYVMWIDSDIVWHSEQIMRLIAIAEQHKQVDIVSGLYIMENETQYATVVNWDIETFKREGRFTFLNKKALKNYDLKELVEVAYTGFGFMLIRNGVFEKVGYPWFLPIWEETESVNGVKVRDFTSEDVGFCRTATENGFKIFVDPNIIVGHEKSKVLY